MIFIVSVPPFHPVILYNVFGNTIVKNKLNIPLGIIYY